jgi:copper chaperone
METLEMNVANVKCNGCAANIKNGLADMAGIEQVEVDVPSGLVTVSGSALAREAIGAKLAELGYPEKAA